MNRCLVLDGFKQSAKVQTIGTVNATPTHTYIGVLTSCPRVIRVCHPSWRKGRPTVAWWSCTGLAPRDPLKRYTVKQCHLHVTSTQRQPSQQWHRSWPALQSKVISHRPVQATPTISPTVKSAIKQPLYVCMYTNCAYYYYYYYLSLM